MPQLNHQNVQGSVFLKTRRRIAATVLAVQNLSGHAETDMKANAPWTDRTTLARNSLNATTALLNTPTSTRIQLRLAHGVQYGVWLELANAGKYAIVGPTATFYRARVSAAVKRIWSKQPL